jgi:hypothetical protein
MPFSSPPPFSAWRHPHRTPLFPSHDQPSRLSLAFVFPCYYIEAVESSSAVSSDPRKTPRLSTPPPLLRPPMTSLAAAGHGGPFTTMESCRSVVAPPSLVSATSGQFLANPLYASLLSALPGVVEANWSRHRALSSRPASTTSTPPHRVGKPPTMKPCPASRLCAASASGVDTAPPSLPPHR